MSEQNEKNVDLTGIREAVRPAVRHLAKRLCSDLGDNLKSLSVVGSALTDDFHPRYSDINTVLVVGRRSHQLLQTIAGYGGAMGKLKLRAPLLMTDEYVKSSQDVFAVELLDFQLNHATVLGPDPFAELTFKKEDVRLQCERESKAALINLRQGYIRVLAKPKRVADMLTACLGDLLPLLRAMLWLVDADRPGQGQPTLTAAAERFQFDPTVLLTLIELKQEHARPATGQVEPLFEQLYQTVDALSRKVDQLA